MRIIDDVKLDFADVLISPKRSQLTSRKDADLTRTFTFKHSHHEWSGIPIIASNMDHTGTIAMCHVLMEYPIPTALCKFVESTEWGWNKNIIRTIGLDQNLDNLPYDSDSAPWICLDVANGYTERFNDYVALMREHEATKGKIIIAGNVCTPEATEQIILAGADIVKIGIGPGSVCTTRKMTGVGYPQLSATIECADAAHGLGGHIITDGGCTVVGDIAKSFGAGADFVMLGGMMAFHDESELKLVDGKYEFYGMSSNRARDIHGARKDGYKAAEGKVVTSEPRGPVKNTVEEMLGGLRGTCAYIGAKRIKDMPKCATFVMVNNQYNKIYGSE